MKMIKIAVMSDNHGDDSQIQDFLKFEKDADYYVHCGDSETWNPELLRRFYAVKGNNDWAIDLKNNIVFEAGGHRILVTHGHRCGYFNREALLAQMAKEQQCDIVFCGHTHMPMNTVVDGIHVINPGSTRLPRGGSANMYCICYLDGPKITVEFRSIFDGQENTVIF